MFPRNGITKFQITRRPTTTAAAPASPKNNFFIYRYLLCINFLKVYIINRTYPAQYIQLLPTPYNNSNNPCRHCHNSHNNNFCKHNVILLFSMIFISTALRKFTQEVKLPAHTFHKFCRIAD